MCKKSHFLAIVFCIEVVSVSVSYAASDYSAKFFQLYRNGSYKEALNYAHYLSSKNPENMTMRYYYADCLMKVGKDNLAIKEFAVITKYSDNEPLKNLARKALDNSAKRQDPEEPKDNFELKLGHELGAEKKRYLEQAENEKKAIMRQFDSKINNIQNSSLSEDQKERQLERTYQELKQQKEEVTARYLRKAEDLQSRKRSLISGSRGTNSSIRVVPTVSGMNVQNYENLGDDSDVDYIPENPPLKAKAQSLKIKTPIKKPVARKNNAKN